MISHKYHNRADWLQGRLMGIGASEAPALMRCPDYKWSSPWSIWAEKTGYIKSETKVEPWQKIGLRLEPVIAELYEEETDRETIDPGAYTIFQSEKNPFQLATFDRIGTDNRVVELKNVGGTYTHWSKGVPLHYQVQVQQQMAVAEVERASVAVLFGSPSFQFKVYDIERNEPFIQAMTEAERAFWRLVETRTEPQADEHPATTSALKRLQMDEETEMAELPDGIEKWDSEREEASRKIKELKKIKDGIDNKIKQAIGEAQIGMRNGVRVFSWKRTARGNRTLNRLLKEGETIESKTQFQEMV